jgi:cyanophycinase
MAGTIALQGGGPFAANDELDRRLLAGVDRVVVLPTADAFEEPGQLVEAARAWGARLGVLVEPMMVLTRHDAVEADLSALAAASAVYLVGDSPIHLRSVLKDTDLLDAILAVVDRGGVLVGVGGSAAALCDPMTDPRGGAFTIGLGVVSGLALACETESWSPEHLHRTLTLADVPVAELPAGAALVHTDAGWEPVGEVTVHGDLSTVTTR